VYNGPGACFAEFNTPAAANAHIDAFSVEGWAAYVSTAFITSVY